MMKPARKRFRIVVVTAGVLLALGGVLLWCAGGLPTFRFLGGCTPAYQRDTRYHATNVYSFEGNFDEVGAKATVELSARGFREESGGSEYNRIFVKGKGKFVEIRVSLKNFALEEATPGSISWARRPGWVSVEVRRSRGHLWEYLPYEWQLWYQRRVLKSNTIILNPPQGPARRTK